MNPGGWDDAVSREKACGLCQSAIASLDDPECRERLRLAERYATELFSADGHRKWDRKQMSGADYLRLQMLIALEAVNTRLFFIAALRDRQAA